MSTSFGPFIHKHCSNIGTRLATSPKRERSVKTTTVGGIRGHVGAKKVRGRKRHLLVDVTDGTAWIEEHLGLSVEIVQHPFRARGEWQIVPVCDDPTRGHFEWFRLPPTKKEFRRILSRGWVGERTFSWLSQSRRLGKEYERLCETSEAMSMPP